MTRLGAWVALCVALTLPGGAAAQSTSGVSDALRAGDAVRLLVSNDEELSGQFVIDERGIVVLPKLGPRQVGGEPAGRVRDAIAAEVAAVTQNLSIEVTVLRRVLVRGEVRMPGTYLLAPYETTIGDALSHAQGLTPDGRTDRVLLVRGGEASVVRFSQSVQLSALPLQSGDELVVPARSWLLRNPALVPTLISGAVSVLITALLVGLQ